MGNEWIKVFNCNSTQSKTSTTIWQIDDLRDADFLPRLKSWGSSHRLGFHDGEVPTSPMGGVWAESVRPPTERAGFIYPPDEVPILTSDSVAQPTTHSKMAVSGTVGFISRLKSWAFSSDLCNHQPFCCFSCIHMV
jgi:hypothetical protein